MTNRYDRLRDIFVEAVDIPSAERPAFLEHACNGDADLRADVERLILADADTPAFLASPAPSETPRFDPGKVLAGRFRVIRFIAAGGMGDVYEVEDFMLHERVALKTIQPEAVGNSRTLQRFKREILYAKRVTHPNVCRIHDLGTHQEPPVEILFLTMALLDGVTLSERLRTSPRLTPAEALPLIVNMADALAAAHDVGIVHRDFKTSNVILVESAGSPKAVVTDFGLARSSSAGAPRPDDASLTDTGKLVGTPAYMAPEQLTGGTITPATDIYALGLVMYEMITGRKPFGGATPLDSALKRLAHPPPSPIEHSPGLDPRWAAVILRCLEREPKRRFQDARDVIRALTTTPSPTETISNNRILAAGRKIRVPLALAFALVFIAAALAGVWILGRHRPPSDALRWYEEGSRALRDGTSFTAMNAFERAVQLDPRFTLAHARLAEAASELDYTDKAKSEMLRATPPAFQAFFLSSQEKLRLEAVYFVLIKDYTQAAAKYKDLAAKVGAEEKPAALVDLGRAYERGGKFLNALESYSSSIALDRQFAAAFLRRAELYGRQQQPLKAAADFDAAEQLYRIEGKTEGLVEVLYQRSTLLRQAGKMAEARAPTLKTLEMARGINDEYHQIRALLALSNLSYGSGDPEGGQQQAQQAVELARRAGIEVLAASGLVDIGNSLFNKGDSAGAEPYLRNAIEIAKRFQAVRVVARAELTLGQVLVKIGKAPDALPIEKQAVDDFEQLGEKTNASRAADVLARMSRDQGEYSAAADIFRRQLQAAESVQDQPGIALASQGLGGVLLLWERYPAALASLDHGAEVSRAIADQSKQAYSEAIGAETLWRVGRYREADQRLLSAEAIAQHLGGNKPLVATIYFYRAAMHLSQRKFPEAEKDVRIMMEAAGPGPFAASEKRLLGLIRASAGRAREGLALCQEAVKIASSANNIPLLKNSELAVAESAAAAGDASAALPLTSALAPYFDGKGQTESLLRTLAASIAVSQGPERSAFQETARSKLKQWQESLGAETYAGFISRPDIQQIIQRIGTVSVVR